MNPDEVNKQSADIFHSDHINPLCYYENFTFRMLCLVLEIQSFFPSSLKGQSESEEFFSCLFVSASDYTFHTHLQNRALLSFSDFQFITWRKTSFPIAYWLLVSSYIFLIPCHWFHWTSLSRPGSRVRHCEIEGMDLGLLGPLWKGFLLSLCCGTSTVVKPLCLPYRKC